MINKVEFVARPGGNGECFLFYVDKETYIRLYGQHSYDMDMECNKRWNEDMPDLKRPEQTEFEVCTGHFFNRDNKKVKVKIEWEEVE
jgi:hypothetical protein